MLIVQVLKFVSINVPKVLIETNLIIVNVIQDFTIFNRYNVKNVIIRVKHALIILNVSYANKILIEILRLRIVYV